MILLYIEENKSKKKNKICSFKVSSLGKSNLKILSNLDWKEVEKVLSIWENK